MKADIFTLDSGIAILTIYAPSEKHAYTALNFLVKQKKRWTLQETETI